MWLVQAYWGPSLLSSRSPIGFFRDIRLIALFILHALGSIQKWGQFKTIEKWKKSQRLSHYSKCMKRIEMLHFTQTPNVLAQNVIGHLHDLEEIEWCSIQKGIYGMTLWASQASAAWREVSILNIEFFRKVLSEAMSSLSLNVVNSRNTTILLWRICLHNGRISMFPAFARCACAQQKTYAPFYRLLSREKSVSWHWHSGLSVHVTPLRHRTVEVDKEWRHCGSTGHPWKAQGSPFSRFNAVTTREDILNSLK